jgi:hypothetical protein
MCGQVNTQFAFMLTKAEFFALFTFQGAWRLALPLARLLIGLGPV